MPNWNVLLTARALDVVGASSIALMKSAGCNLIVSPKKSPIASHDLIPLLDGIDATLCSPDKFIPEVFAAPAARDLKIISRWGVGYDSIDVPAATADGVVVAYCPGMLNDAVADYAFAMLAALARRLHEGHAGMRAGRWSAIWGHDISHKTIGIIGCGRIGQALARRAAGFEMRILGYDVAPSPEAAKFGIQFVALDELLSQSDFVSLHAALTTETRNLIGAPQLRRMKPSAYLINTARGPLVDEAALIQALNEGWIAGAALDTYVVEPLPETHPLRTTPNLLMMPHQASFARDTGERVSLAAAQAIVDLMQGRRPQHVVDTTIFNSPKLRAQLPAR